MNVILQAIAQNGAAPSNNDISLLFCLRGNALINIEDKYIRIDSGQGYVALPGKVYTIADRSGDCDFIETVIPVGMLEGSRGINDVTADVALISRHPVFELDDKERESLIQIAALCEGLKTQEGRYKEKCMVNTYMSLIYLICEAACKNSEATEPFSGGSDRQNSYFTSFLNLLARHCREERNVGFYADKLCITPKYLSTVVKSVSGKTASDWIDEFVIAEAKEHLRFSGKSIQEISYMLNFSTQSFFGKYFKRLTGVSPVRYKVMAASA